MRDFNLVKADLIKHLNLSFKADNGTIYWYEGTMAALFAMMSFCFDIEHNHKIEVKPVSNADRIRSMADEQLAEWLCRKADCNEYCCAYRSYCNKNDEACKQAWLEWLKADGGDA